VTATGRSYLGGRRHSRVVQDLGSAIVRGRISPGAVMPTENELVEEYGVGRSALREGVKVLAGKGLLETRTSAGTRVRPRGSWNLLDPDVLHWRLNPETSQRDLAMVANLRVALEPGAARLAAESTDIAARRDVPVQMARLWATVDDPEAFVEADLAFHHSVFVASGNELLIYIYDVVSEALRLVRPLHTNSVAHNRETLPNHERVARSIVYGHHLKAEHFMRTIVEVARADALRQGHTGRAKPHRSNRAGPIVPVEA
jgi:GntR family transcriptional regulator, galactonate operon transcriptional repressor